MPETTMNKDDGAMPGQNQIRVTWYARVMQAIPKAARMQGLAKRQFRLRILASNARHHSRPGLAVHDVSHATWP